jgi:transposase-like protein
VVRQRKRYSAEMKARVALEAIKGQKTMNEFAMEYGVHPNLEQRAARLDRVRWRQLRRESTRAQSEQLTRFRFRHKRQALLASLEERWATTAQSAPLP